MNIDKIHIKRVAFPSEHGAWGFFLEPIILSLIISYSTSGFLLGLCSLTLFFMHQPIRIILKKSPKQYYNFAQIFVIIYSIVISILFFAIFSISEIFTFLIPYFFAILLMLFYLLMELKNISRALLIELIAPVSVSLMAISFTIINSWSIFYIIALGIVILSRSIPTVLYVHNKLKYFKGYAPNKTIVHSSGLLFLVIISFLAINNLIPKLVIIANIILILRAIIGFFPKNKFEKVKILGIKEFLYGILFVIITAIGYLLKI